MIKCFAQGHNTVSTMPLLISGWAHYHWATVLPAHWVHYGYFTLFSHLIFSESNVFLNIKYWFIVQVKKCGSWSAGFIRSQLIRIYTIFKSVYSKTCVKRLLSKRQKIVFQDQFCLMQVKSIAECSKGSILQYFWPSLSYHLSLRSLFCLFLSGCFTQVLLYDFEEKVLPIVCLWGWIS